MLRILFAVNNDSILNTVVDLLSKENVDLYFDKDNDTVSSRELIIEKLKYNLSNPSETKYDLVLISEKLEGEYDLLEICRFVKKNKIRPIILMGQKRDDDPFIHALIKRKIYDFLYGKLSYRDIINCILVPRKYEDIEHLVDQAADEYVISGERIVTSEERTELDEDLTGESMEGEEDEEDESSRRSGLFGLSELGKKIRVPDFSILRKPKDEEDEEEEEEKPRRTVKVNKSADEQKELEFKQLPRRRARRGENDYRKSIAVFSNQQVGKSFVACNLATVFATSGIKTALVDLDFKNKSQYYHFNFSAYEKKAQSIDEIDGVKKVFESTVFDSENISELFFSPVRNLYVITSHPDINIREYDLDSLYRVYCLLKSIFKIVIYDMPSNCGTEYIKFLMTQVDDIVIITNQNCNVLDRTERDLRDVVRGFFVSNKVSLLINQFITHGIINKKSIVDHLSQISSSLGDVKIKFKHVFTIPNDYELLVKSITEGKPAVLVDHEMEHAFLDMAVAFYPDIKY